MNGEIKEILEKIKNWCDLALDDNCNTIMYKYELVAILDSITNLQEKLRIRDTNWQSLKYYLEKLYDRDYIEEEIFDDICKRVNELESQIEIKSYQKEITNLQEENEKLKKELQQEKKDFKEANDYCFELKDYKSRNEKATEHLKEVMKDEEEYEEDYIYNKYLLDILQGEKMNKEEIIKELNKPENKLIMECNSKDKQIDLCRSILLDILKEKVEKDKEIERLRTELAKIPRYKMEYELEIDKLKNELEELEKNHDFRVEQVHNLQKRIDKAIEYINSDEMLKLREDFEYCNDKDLFDEFAGHLDRILRGSDKE